jgi:hypothetical protein
MIKRFVQFAAVAFLFASASHAADPFVGDGMADKGTHGLVNIFTGWMEIPVQMKQGYDSGYSEERNRISPAESRTAGFVGGFFTGSANAVGRTFTGVYQLAGFWSANHESNEGVGHHLGKEYAWQKSAPPEPTCPGKRIEAKLGRGFGDLTAGPAEIPIQADKTWTVDRIHDPGFGKGLWFATSRIYGGVFDIVGFVLPGYQKTYGYGYDTESPFWHYGCPFACYDCSSCDGCDKKKDCGKKECDKKEESEKK